MTTRSFLLTENNLFLRKQKLRPAASVQRQLKHNAGRASKLAANVHSQRI
jgi:hypothetical protein